MPVTTDATPVPISATKSTTSSTNFTNPSNKDMINVDTVAATLLNTSPTFLTPPTTFSVILDTTLLFEKIAPVAAPSAAPIKGLPKIDPTTPPIAPNVAALSALVVVSASSPVVVSIVKFSVLFSSAMLLIVLLSSTISVSNLAFTSILLLGCSTPSVNSLSDTQA